MNVRAEGVNGFAASARALSPREWEVMRLHFGQTRGGVAHMMGLSLNTVAKHLSSAYRKLGVTCRADAVMRLDDTSPGWRTSTVKATE